MKQITDHKYTEGRIGPGVCDNEDADGFCGATVERHLSKEEIITEAYVMLSRLATLIDNHFYHTYSSEGLKAELNKIYSIQSALETLE